MAETTTAKRSDNKIQGLGTMGSLTNAVSTLERLIESKIDGDFPTNQSIEDIQRFLVRCDTPNEMTEWHKEEISWILEVSGPRELLTLCENVGSSLVKAAQKVAVLRLWALRNLKLTVLEVAPKLLLYGALEDVLTAFKFFETVATDAELRARDVLETVRVYLKKVFGLTIVLGSLAWPDGWFEEWDHLHRHTRLEGFKFDTRDWYIKSQIADPTCRGVLAPQSRIPSLYLPAYPTLPIRDDGTYHYLVPKASQCPESDDEPANSL